MSSELELCEQFGVSRTVLREALRMLSGRGLIRIEKGRGIFVNELSAETVTIPMELYLHQNTGSLHALEVIRARQLIEPPIAAEAARRHTPEDAARLRQDLEDLKACRGGSSNLSRLDMAFHLHIAEASGNPVVPLLVQPIHALMPRIKVSVHKAVKEAKEAAVMWHGKILEAILRREADDAYAFMVQHLDVAEAHVRQVLSSQQTEDGQAEDGQAETERPG